MSSKYIIFITRLLVDERFCSKVQTQSGATIRQLDFTPMDAFMSHVLEAFRIDAETAHSVFPSKAKVVLSFCDRLSNEVVCSFFYTVEAT